MTGGAPATANAELELERDRARFAYRRRANCLPGETLAAARARWALESRCRDCGDRLPRGATGRRCGHCHDGAQDRRAARREAPDAPPSRGQMRALALALDAHDAGDLAALPAPRTRTEASERINAANARPVRRTA